MKIKFINFWGKDEINLKILCFLELGIYETKENWQIAITIFNFRISIIF